MVQAKAFCEQLKDRKARELERQRMCESVDNSKTALQDKLADARVMELKEKIGQGM